MSRMLALFASLALLVPSLIAQETEAETIKITVKPFAVGTVINSAMKGKGDMAQTVSVAGQVMQEMKMTMNMTDKRRWTVLASDEKGVSKIRLDVLEAKEEMEAEGAPEGALEDETSPLDGKAFTITRGETEPTIEAIGDFEVTSAMKAKIVEDLHDSTGALLSPTSGLDKLLERGSFTVGETIKLDAKDLEKFMGGDKDLPANAMTLEPTGTRTVLGTECCVFDVKIDAKDPEAEEEAAMSATFSGEILIAKNTGWLQSMKFGGPMTFSMNQEQDGMAIEIAGNGKMDIDLMSIYSKAQLDK